MNIHAGLGKHNYIRGILLISGLLFVLCLSGCSSTAESEALESAEIDVEDRDFEGALTTLTAAEESGVKSRALYRSIGIAKMGTGDYEGAAEAFKKALSKSSGIPDDMDYDINYYLATCFYKLGDLDEAKKVYDTILSLRSDETKAYRLRATIEAESGDPVAADADLRKAINLNDTDYDAVISAFEVMDQHGYTEQGKQYLLEALDRNEDMSNYDKGRLYYYLQNYDSAKACLENAKTEEEGSYRTTLLLGKTYEALGSIDYAADTYESYIAGDSTRPEMYNQLGLSRLKLGNPEAALTAFEEGEKIAEGSILQSIKYNEIVAYEYLSEFEQAKLLMEDYLKQYPEDEDAKRENIFLKSR